jgi:dihydrodipicolinate synthase/N-acetylneuraminate lyase
MWSAWRAKLPLPTLLYNAPSFTKLSYAPSTVQVLADLPQVVGLKDSSWDRIYFHNVRHLLGERPNFSMLVGPEELLADLLSVLGFEWGSGAVDGSGKISLGPYSCGSEGIEGTSLPGLP